MSEIRFKCRCGKLYAMSEADAKGLRKFIAAKTGHDNPVRYYKCGYGGWHWTRMLEVNKPRPAKVFRECGAEDCTNIFEANPANADHRYCSKTCSKREQRRRQRRSRTCVNCGEPYQPVDVDQRYCNRVCRQQYDMVKFARRHPVTPLSVKKMHDFPIQN